MVVVFLLPFLQCGIRIVATHKVEQCLQQMFGESVAGRHSMQIHIQTDSVYFIVFPPVCRIQTKNHVIRSIVIEFSIDN